MNNRFIFTTALLLGLAMSIFAQTPERKWGIGIQGGSEQYNGDFGNGFYNFDQPFYGFGGISLSRSLGEHLDIEGNATIGEIGHRELDSDNRFRFSMMQANINLKYNFFKYDKVKFRPFVFAGIGYLRFEDKNSDRKLDNMQLPDFGFGFTYHLSPAVSIVFKETFMYSDYDNIELEVGKQNDFYMQHSLGIVFNLGKAKDDDGDGIPNRKDLCPQQAGLEAFGGCPDTDGDGIKDSEDKCPKVKGLKEFEGCPDTDGDGVKDSEDKCPKVKGLKEFNGCPDTDGDGVADGDDNCPKVKGLKEFNGCPDTDGDGVEDSKDRCPKVKGLKTLKGCPDTDGDGIADIDDVCPKVKGLKKNKGCPEVKKEEKKILEKALHGIKFKSAKSIIAPSSYGILDNVVSIMKNNPKYNLRIEGHTDSQGKDEFNLKLSKERAAAVKNYLMKKGIGADRLSSEGFGEAVPIADNKTAKGRAENRRVELTVVF